MIKVDFWFYHCAVFGFISDCGWAQAPTIAKYMFDNQSIVIHSYAVDENFMDCAKKIIALLNKDGFK